MKDYKVMRAPVDVSMKDLLMDLAKEGVDHAVLIIGEVHVLITIANATEAPRITKAVKEIIRAPR